MAEHITDHQKNMLQMFANGKAIKQIARELGISQKTVRNTLTVVHNKMEQPSTAMCAITALRQGWIE